MTHAKLSSFTVCKLTWSSCTSSYACTRGCKLKCVTYHALKVWSGHTMIYLFDSKITWLVLRKTKTTFVSLGGHYSYQTIISNFTYNLFICSFARHNRTEINAQTETNTCHLNIISSFYWISVQTLKQKSYLSVRHSALALSQAVAKGKRRLRMESKANKNSHVLMFGFSVNLIPTLGSLGFTCYSLHRLDSRLTTLERNSLLKNSPYQISDPFSVAPTSAHFRPSGSLEKETGRVQRAVERPSMCHKCSSVCANLNGQRGVSFTLLSFLFFKCQ